MFLVPAALFVAAVSASASPTDIMIPADNLRIEVVQPTELYAKTNRPPAQERLFTSAAVESEIARVKALLTTRKLAWMFENCFPNTLDTTVNYSKKEGADDTFVYTGDIHAMWLRDSAAQVWPYIPLAERDDDLRRMIAGVINRQVECILIDPYANAFNNGAGESEWMSDNTKMRPELHERKWEIDSLCYPIRLAYQYWKTTGDVSVFGERWVEAVEMIVKTFREQQRKENRGPYRFERRTTRALDTMTNGGWGNPVKPVGLIASCFRPSDDASTFLFLVPSNFFAVTSLRKAAEIVETVNGNLSLALDCRALADEVEAALKQYAVYPHPKYGDIYAYEVDGFGNHLLTDDANVPSLLSMAYLGDVPADDPIYRNTRRFVWSEDNPYFFKGSACEGIGGPHIGYDMIWPMSIMMRAFTSTDDNEIKECVKMLLDTDADTGFMHESFHKDNPAKFTRSWFAWQNTLFGELILKLIADGKTDLLNSIE
jgi:meiotically up-regulated gene 157 (Mug157) protein